MSFVTFPLFQSLFQDTKDLHKDPFRKEDQEFILEHITNLDENGREIFYAIIRQDQLERTPTSAETLPNCCKQMKSGIRIDFDRIPNPVKHMLHSFIKKYLRKLNEDATFFANMKVPSTSQQHD
jgi:hypothetical protein